LLQYDLVVLGEVSVAAVARVVLPRLHAVAVEVQKTVLIANTSDPRVRGLFGRMGAEEALAGVENRLSLTTLDWGMVAQWDQAGRSRNPATALRFVEEIPEDVLERFCRVYTEVENQQPLGSLDVNAILTTPETLRQREATLRQMGRTRITAFTVEADGAISGLTEMVYNPGRETMIAQLLTGVQEAYRRRGLGKWLKAAMLLYIRDRYPAVTVVTTDNATTNAPMLSINERLGFRVYKESVTSQITTDKLGQYLQSQTG
jgi:GNAT superfamily N-acetyltransferase